MIAIKEMPTPLKPYSPQAQDGLKLFMFTCKPYIIFENYYTAQIMHVQIKVTNMKIWGFWPDTEQCLHEKHASKSVQHQFDSFSQVGPIDHNLLTPVVGLHPLGGRLLMNIEQCCLKMVNYSLLQSYIFQS